MNIFKMVKLDRSELVLLFLMLATAKYCLALFFFTDFAVFGGGNDADFYDSYARGGSDADANIWPILLRQLYALGLYDRAFVTLVLLLCGLVIVPLLSASLISRSVGDGGDSYRWTMLFSAALYPTVFFYSLDMYREILMLILFLMGLLSAKTYYQYSGGPWRFVLIPLLASIAFVLAQFRPYLGFAFALAWVLSVPFKVWRSHAAFVLIAYLSALSLCFALGFFDPVIDYREQFLVGEVGGSTFGIDLREGGVSGFPVKFATNLAYQIFGLKIYSFPSAFLFFAETIPFSVFLFLLFKNRRYSSQFVDFLFLFAIIYSTIWLIGNDNLGTAIRLRIFTYFPIAVAALIVCSNAKRHFRNDRSLVRSRRYDCVSER